MRTATHTAHVTEPCRWPRREAFEENLREVRRAATTGRHAAEDTIADVALTIRRHPLRAVAGAVCAAGIAGIVLGFGAGWLARMRR